MLQSMAPVSRMHEMWQQLPWSLESFHSRRSRGLDGLRGLPDGCNGSIQAAAKFADGRIAVGGVFSLCGSVAANRIAIYTPATDSWSGLATGIQPATQTEFIQINALAVVGNDLYVGGQFERAGGVTVNNIARWDGSVWTALGNGLDQGGQVDALAASGGSLYVGGTFGSIGGVIAQRVARWDGNSWSSLGSGASNGVNGRVLSIGVSGADVYVGGGFTLAGGITANRVARWDGLGWSGLGSGVGSSASDVIQTLAVSGNVVYVGGQFTQAGGVSALRIARWNGISWSSISGIPGDGVNSRVYSLAVSESSIFLVGAFSQAGGLAASYAAQWDGNQWRTMGAGLDRPAASLLVAGGDVFAFGEFRRAGGSLMNNAARWDGIQWNVMGPSIQTQGLNGSVGSLAVSENDVFVGGGFTQVGAVAANYLARWDGNAWSSLGANPGQLTLRSQFQGTIFSLAACLVRRAMCLPTTLHAGTRAHGARSGAVSALAEIRVTMSAFWRCSGAICT